MGTKVRNPGLLAVTAGVILAIVFAALGVVGALELQLGLGLAVILLVTAALLYIFFSRANAVVRTGYASLLMIVATALILPLLSVNQAQQQASASSQLYDVQLHKGAAIFGQYCALCHGYQGQGINGPPLNNNPDVSKLSNEELTRIISGGIADPNNPKTLLMPAWLQAYGGALTEEDISDLVAFIRSSDPTYRKNNQLPSANGFDYVLGTLTNPTQIADYHSQKQTGSRPPLTQFTDMTGKGTVTVPIIDSTTLVPGTNWSFSPRYIIVSVGTKITWNNISTQPHTVVPKKQGAFTPSSVLGAGTGTYTYTFTTAGDYPYYCGIHPAMTAWIIVK
jgi:plastocyanin/mono/diheme cytochrome c family protein